MWKKLLASVTAISIIGVVVVQAQVVPDEFAAKDWNANEKVVGDVITTEFYQKYVNYYENGWKKTDLKPVKSGTKYVITKAPFGAEFPERANGTFKFTNKHEYAPATKTFISEAPISKTRTFTDASNVLGTPTDSGMEYIGAIPNTDALIIESDTDQVRYLLKWNAKPSICSTQSTFTVNFRQTPDAGLVPRKRDNTMVKGTDEDLSGFSFSSGQRSITTPSANIWDAANKRAPVVIRGKWNPAQFNGYKVIDCAFFDRAVFPVFSDDVDTFFSDPSVELTTVDGYITCNASCGATFAAARAASVGNNSNDTDTTVYAYTYTTPILARSAMLFDATATTFLGSIDSVTLQLYSVSKINNDNDGDDTVVVVSSNPASNTSLVTADYNDFGATAYATAVDITGITTGAYNTFTFNATGRATISAAILKYGIVEGHDFTGNAPAGTNEAAFSSADTTGTSQDPVLTVTHTAAAASPSAPKRKTGGSFDEWTFIPKVFAFKK